MVKVNDSTGSKNSRSDTDIIALFVRIQANDPAAFDAFHTLLAPRMLAYCLSFTRDIDAAHDLLQTTMLNVYENRGRYSDGNLMAWLFTIARNICRTWQIRSKRFEPLPEDFEMAASDGPSLDADEISLIQHAILQLSDEFRTVVVLHYFGNMALNEIAEAEEISLSLVKMRLFRARKKLATYLSKALEAHHG